MSEEKITEDTVDELAKEVTEDFLKRQNERRFLERGWQLDMNFVSGNQYCDVNSSGEIYEEDKKYFWQSRRVFNHVAPAVDMRCSKLGRIRPALTVRAASEEEKDKHSASLASAILSSVFDEEDLDGVITDATVWSETCGTAFYKVTWDGLAGGTVGKDADGRKLRQGGVKVSAVSPFEIYPYTLSEEKLANQPSIIHAKAMPVQDIYALYGVKLAGRDIDEFSLVPYSAAAHSRRAETEIKAVRRGYELVIERYCRATDEFPEGRLTVVAGGKLLYDGALPYINGDDGERGYPFIKQTSLQLAGSFFGVSVVDRLIPLQRAYNAVKNRKHEFLNRISMGTVAVEDGSVDVDEFIEDGLIPGKVVVYRQGSKPPEMLQFGSVPSSFSDEEENLLSEFAKVSGTGEIAENADSYAGVTSATGLQLIIDQDEARLENSYQQIKRAIKLIGRHILRLYRQFATDVRLLKYAGENNVLSVYYFKGSDISSDDVVLETDSEANMSPSQRRATVYEMLDRGLFADENGNLSPAAKNKILELLGYKGFAGARDLGELNRARAGEENLKMKSGESEVKTYDDHAVHITEHTAFLLTENLTAEAEARICAHIDMHKQSLAQSSAQN
ncbi:MAG: hypothetical protein K2O41_01885 [Clostridia bacterium]|nr:hypothetical protein [Clostridia bacterium]